MSMLGYVGVSIVSLLVWITLLVYFAFSTNLPRVGFVSLHYLTTIVSASGLFALYFKFVTPLDPFRTMLVAMITVFCIELLFFNFIYKEELWFFNFVDWIVPVFLLASSVYLTTKFMST